MNPQWHFNPRRPCDRMRDSANDAFFTAESLENLSEALVREAIQNSLDAAQRDTGGVRQVTVRIRFVANAPEEARRFLAGHFASARQNFERGLGRPSLSPLFAEETGYIVLEDFGTRGLTGDVNECRLEPAQQNAFFSFFRAEGQSAKTGENPRPLGHRQAGLPHRQPAPRHARPDGARRPSGSRADGFGSRADSFHRRARLPAGRLVRLS